MTASGACRGWTSRSSGRWPRTSGSGAWCVTVGRPPARDAHTVHVEVEGLRPGREYHYRFRTGPHRSVAAVTRTAPAYGSSPQSVRLAIASCAQLEHGFFSAYRDIAQRRPDLVVHLGDYFYEYERGGYDLVELPRRVRDHAGPEARTLAGYRLRHAQYRADPDLQAAHAAAPWAVVWDDHEVDNNWAGRVPEELEGPQPDWLERRAAAFRAATPTSLRADFMSLPFVQRPGARASASASWIVEAGRPGWQPA